MLRCWGGVVARWGAVATIFVAICAAIWTQCGMTNMIIAALRRAFTPRPWAPDTPMKRRGEQAFTDNDLRRPPASASPQEQIEWLAGWDEALHDQFRTP